ncbi:S41 family peptidase [Niabella hirudinis]|uniref:S41 family peptidase n=1 Tax=Niabella hirudinis TaxID=1285929 RepID=UPI003EC02D26
MFLSKPVVSAFLCVLILLASCRPKDNIVPPKPTGVTPEQLADSLYLYAKQAYYWNSSLPDISSFNPRRYATADTLGGLEDELYQISRTALNPATGFPYEQYINFSTNLPEINVCKYSYILPTEETVSGGASAFAITNQATVKNIKMTLDGKENNLGFVPASIPVDNTDDTKEKIPYHNGDSSVIFVRAVTNGSPAWNAGLRRGDIISKFNGKSLNADNAADLAAINSAINAASITLTIYKPSTNTSKDLSFSKAVYSFNPVYKDTVLTIGSKKIGYIAYKSFTQESNSKPVLDASFAKFSGITDIVVDLRYNGGGYVDMAEYFGELLAPANANSKVLFVEYYNQLMQNGQATILKNQPVYGADGKAKGYSYFDVDYTPGSNTTYVLKKGPVNNSNEIKNIYFIVSEATASASELLINSLKPYFNTTTLIGARFEYGRASTTYGKPVGFFELRIGKYSVYMANFETKNAQGTGGYYTGMPVNIQSIDDIRYDLGDPNETCFLKAIRAITGDPLYKPAAAAQRSLGSISATTESTMNLKGRISIGSPATINGMFARPQK